MVDVNPQAIELNETIKENNNTVYELLSGRGKAIFFPKKGILAQAADAKGKEINATIGIALEEDLTPMRLKPLAKLTKKLDPKDIFPYAPSFGKPELREKWKQMILQKNPSIKNEISLPVVTNALTHGLSIVSYLFLNNEESIILPDKFWGNYKLIFTNTYGAQLDTFNMFKDGLFDLESFQNKLNENQNTKKVILLNFPNNPTGYTIINEEAEKITELIKQQAEKGDKIAVIIDDAYFGLVYKDDVYKESIFSKLSNLHENVLAIKVDGSTKEDYVWGFRVGFLTFGIKNGTKELYQALENKTAGAIRGTISNSPNISQSLLLKAFEAKNYQKEKEKKYNLLKARYEEVRNILRDEKYGKFFKPLPFNSGYFMCIELKDLDAEQVRQILLNKYSTGIIAMGNLIRIAFSSINKKSIQKLFDNIYNACSEIKGESNGK